MKYSLELQIRSISASLSGKGEKRDLSVSHLSLSSIRESSREGGSAETNLLKLSRPAITLPFVASAWRLRKSSKGHKRGNFSASLFTKEIRKETCALCHI